MQNIIIWAISFWIFSSSMFFPDQGRFQSRWFYFFPGNSGLRFIEIVDSGLDEKRAALVIERKSPLGPVMRTFQTRPVFRAFMGDIDQDGQDDLILGITKTIGGEKFRRVYIFHDGSGFFHPKWLGSRLSFRLLEFSTTPIAGRLGLTTLEKHSGKLYKGKYLWDQFGFRTISISPK